jgi:hypothetical protein
MRIFAVLAAIAMTSVPNVATAKDKLDPRLQSMVACRALTDGTARLQCYDQAMLALNQAVEKGEVRVEATSGPRMLDGVVKASGKEGENRFWIEMENGDRWVLLPKTDRKRPPQPGTRVKIRKTMLDSAYWVSGEGWSESRARFVKAAS